VHHSIATGSQWFNAWLAQYCTPLTPLARKSGVPVSRLVAFVKGGPITKDEVAKLAQVWGHEPDDIIASLPDPALLIA
jgi:plasmid maintenance system antidote protein VapI